MGEADEGLDYKILLEVEKEYYSERGRMGPGVAKVWVIAVIVLVVVGAFSGSRGFFNAETYALGFITACLIGVFFYGTRYQKIEIEKEVRWRMQLKGENPKP